MRTPKAGLAGGGPDVGGGADISCILKHPGHSPHENLKRTASDSSTSTTSSGNILVGCIYNFIDGTIYLSVISMTSSRAVNASASPLDVHSTTTYASTRLWI